MSALLQDYDLKGLQTFRHIVDKLLLSISAAQAVQLYVSKRKWTGSHQTEVLLLLAEALYCQLKKDCYSAVVN